MNVSGRVYSFWDLQGKQSTSKCGSYVASLQTPIFYASFILVDVDDIITFQTLPEAMLCMDMREVEVLTPHIPSPHHAAPSHLRPCLVLGN